MKLEFDKRSFVPPGFWDTLIVLNVVQSAGLGSGA